MTTPLLILGGLMSAWILCILVGCAIELRHHTKSKKLQRRWRDRMSVTSSATDRGNV